LEQIEPAIHVVIEAVHLLRAERRHLHRVGEVVEEIARIRGDPSA
jgi:hypothetical protein